MNLTKLDKAQLEAILLDPPDQEDEPLCCSEQFVTDHLPAPATVRDKRLRHVLAAAHELLSRIAAQSIVDRSIVESPRAAEQFLRIYFAGAERELFVLVFLDTRNRVLAVEELFAGTLTQTSVYPREVIKQALHHNAAAIMCAHNHPSGEREPSSADKHLTSVLKQALAVVDVQLVDHLVVCATGITSFAERGLL